MPPPDSTSPPKDAAPAELTHRQRLIVILGLVLATFLSALDQTILGTTLPRIASDLGGGHEIAWVMSGYLLAATMATPIYGKISDMFGRRVVLEIAIVIFIVTSIFCALASTLTQLIVARVLQGLGGAGLATLAMTTLADIVPPRERGRYQAYNSGAWFLASFAGPVLGGIFADYLTWRYAFWINLPIGMAALAVAHFGLKALPVRHVRRRIDVLGALLIMSAAGCAMLVTTLGGVDLDWSSPLLLSLAAGAILLSAAAVVQERVAREPILAPRLFANRTFLICIVVNLLAAAAYIGTYSYLPVYFQLAHGVSAADSGLLMLPVFMIWPLVSIVSSRTVSATGRYKIFPLVGTAISAVALALLALPYPPGSSITLIVVLTAVSGIGAGCVGPIVMLAAQNSVNAHDLGSATGAYSFFRNLGGSFGVAALGTIAVAGLDSRVRLVPGHEALGERPGMELLHAGANAIGLAPPPLRDAVAGAMAGAFNAMFLAGAVVLALAFLATCFLKEQPLRTTSALAEREGGAAKR